MSREARTSDVTKVVQIEFDETSDSIKVVEKHPM